ncbi:MAG TPA: hypothetical protein VK943_12880 [Arenibaculum sp.]|nr:hypothetical protein [Arenibaculum sp.]
MKPSRAIAIAAVAALPALSGGPAEADWRDGLNESVDAAKDFATEMAIEAERAVVAGGVVLYRYRHTVAGGVIGCAAGAALGATASAGASVATGGAALPSVGPATALGCGAGAAYGVSLGYPLDTMFDEP